MKNLNVEARIKRNGLRVIAGEFYRDANSHIVKDLNCKDKKALLGIQENDAKYYTIIGENLVYYMNKFGVEGEITHANFLKTLNVNAISKGKSRAFDFIDIDENNSIWLMNASTMNALWNTILLFYDSKDNV
jgi:hypothetical protein